MWPTIVMECQDQFGSSRVIDKGLSYPLMQVGHGDTETLDAKLVI